MRLLARKLVDCSKLSFTRICAGRQYSKEVKKDEKENKLENIPRNVIVERYGEIVTLNIDRQITRNSLDIVTLREIEAVIDEFDKDEKAKVLVFHGEGGSFCSGYDVDELEETGYNALFDASARLRRRPMCDKVTIAAISGYAVAEGFELALACDLRVIEDTAILGCLGRRFGVPLGLLGGRRLTALIGLSRALDLLITGRQITGVEAHEKGLAAKLTTTGTALGEAIKLAKSIVKFPQAALMMDKLQAVNSTLNPNSEDSMRDEAHAQILLGQAVEDIKEGLQKFQSGIGRHGKFYKLTEVPMKDWELEDSVEEVTVIEADPDAPKEDSDDKKKK
ncbi:unnamed protein product [Plutella xylostella]|uniref:(diamondback moth) hypothetical protein n=1 Tax=Plutella xylostella TaxID=51655 RepID=A0A8S4FDC7_PLUXY|nr:unnamed protein product [Plutella xylostella]